jgi:toxin ParE1/3/4
VRRIKYKPLSVGDLNEIWTHSEAKWDRSQADAYVGQLLDGVERLRSARNPGRPFVHDLPGLRRARIGSHFVFFICSESEFEVRRILHVRMNADKHLKKG